MQALRFGENVLGLPPAIPTASTSSPPMRPFTSATKRPRPAPCRAARAITICSTHLPWVGLRTNDPAGAHIEYVRGIQNPVAIKVGDGTPREHVARWLDLIDPEREPGRLTLIHRFGARKIEDGLPALMEMVRAEGGRPLWICDAMHGNTQTTSGDIKTAPAPGSGRRPPARRPGRWCRGRTSPDQADVVEEDHTGLDSPAGAERP